VYICPTSKITDTGGCKAPLTTRRKRMTDPEIIHLLTVICGTAAIIILAGVFIIIRNRQQRDDEDES